MKLIKCIFAILALSAVVATEGKGAKPLIPGDYSDPDVIRVGTNYYMVTSSFQMSPGVPVLRSCDLKNWTTVAHAVPDLAKFSPKYGPDRMQMYGKGIYAPSIREHNGKFYVYVPSVDEGIIVSVAEKPEGPWQADWLKKSDGTPWKEGRWSDPCPFWEGGNGWIAMSALHRNWTGWLFKLSDDGMRLLGEGWCFSPYRSTEGHKIYKRGDWYYLFHIEFLNDGHGEGSYFLRSKDINGPYELKYVPLTIPGQGALVDDAEGRTWWIAQFNTPKEPIGRAPYICPVEWKDGWPEIGEPTNAFSGGSCEQAWQCNHVCEDGAWDFESRPGWLRIKGRKGKDFFHTPNIACKRVLQYGDETIIAVDVDTSGLEDGEEAGLALFNGGVDYAICKGVRSGDVMHCEWRISGERCRSNDGQALSMRGEKYRGINWGLYTTGTADFRVYTNLEYLKAAGIYQWSVEVPELVSRETGDHPRAYLWIPETCEKVRGVVVGNDNMLEETLFAHEDFRRELAAADLAVVFVQPGFQGMNMKCDTEDAKIIFQTLARLGEESGYSELGVVPVAPLGHSAWSDWPWYMAFAVRERLFAAVSLKGAWPHMKPYRENFAARLSGLPALLVGGEYEGFEKGMAENAAYYEKQTNDTFRIVCDWGAGHFDYSPELPGMLGRFLTQSCRAAENAEKEKPLRLSSLCVKKENPDGVVALMGFRTKDGKVIEQNPKYHLQITIPWEPEADGKTFSLESVYLDTVPPGRPEGWTGKKAGDAAPHPADESAIDVDIVQGGGVKVGRNRFELKFDRRGFKGYRARELVIKEVSPAQEGFKRSVQQAILRFPLKAHEGEVAEPTGWYVREGAAEVDDKGNITWLPLPPRAKMPHVATLCKYRREPDGDTVYQFVRVER